MGENIVPFLATWGCRLHKLISLVHNILNLVCISKSKPNKQYVLFYEFEVDHTLFALARVYMGAF